jgi:hypothetical protein
MNPKQATGLITHPALVWSKSIPRGKFPPVLLAPPTLPDLPGLFFLPFTQESNQPEHEKPNANEYRNERGDQHEPMLVKKHVLMVDQWSDTYDDTYPTNEHGHAVSDFVIYVRLT